jgi:DNA-binding transcriptional MerR regulator
MLPVRGDGFLGTVQLAQMLGVAPATIRSWRYRGWIEPQGLDEHGRPLYTRQAGREAERTVRRNGLRASGIDPRQLRRGMRVAA